MHTKSVYKSWVLLIALAVALLPFQTRTAKASCMCEAMALATEEMEWNMEGSGTVPVIKDHVTDEFKAYRSWFISIFWEDNFLPLLQMLATQLSTSSMQQSQMIGSMIDAENYSETQRALQEVKAEAQRIYNPSVGMCELGSGVKSLATSERRGEFNARVMSQRSISRQLGTRGSSGSSGGIDQASRMQQFRTKFCDKRSNNGGLETVCSATSETANSDIDYSRMIDAPLTLNVNLSGEPGVNGDDEAAVFELASNLYSHDLIARPSAALLAPDPKGGVTNMQKNYLDARAVIAKRSVAEASYNAIVALKSAGSNESGSYLTAILQGFGMSANEAKSLIGDNPSYFAQMGVMTKVAQNPNFYTKLYESPENVRRKDVALQAIELMQKYDILESNLRTEASLSVLLELALQDQQDEAEGEINPQTSLGAPAPKATGSN